MTFSFFFFLLIIITQKSEQLATLPLLQNDVFFFTNPWTLATYPIITVLSNPNHDSPCVFSLKHHAATGAGVVDGGTGIAVFDSAEHKYRPAG